MIKKAMKLFFLICVLGFSSIQAQTVTGKITDAADGSPLPGVNVIIKGTTTGVSSDFDGNYSINVSDPNAILQFSYMGYSDVEVTFNGNTTINVSLEVNAESLDEVVVTALGIKREAKAVGYAMAEVDGEELAKTNTVSPVNALQGQVAGVSVSGSDGGLFGNSKIQIRGISSLNSGNNQPIFVIDGVILENGTSNTSADWNGNANDYGNILKNLNADEYESVSVLKGAAATALYGSRGINGVVLIKTKEGSSSRGIGVSFKQSFNVDHVYKQPALQNVYGPGTLAGYVNYGEKNADDQYYRFDDNQFYYNEAGDRTLINHAGGGLSYGPKFDGQPIEDLDGNMIPYSPNKNNMLDVYDDGMGSNTSLALSGGNDKGTFYFSDSYTTRTGMLPNNSFNRNALLLKGSYELAKWLKVNASVSFTKSASKNPRNDVSQGFFDGTFERTYNTKKYTQEEYWLADHGGVTNSIYGDENAFAPRRNLWFAYEMNDQVRDETVTRPIVQLNATLTDWLNVTLEGNMNQYTSKYENKVLGQGFANEGGSYQLNHSEDVSRTGKLSFNSNLDLAPDFTGSFVLGGEMWDQEKSNTNIWTNGGLIVPGKFFLNNSKQTRGSSGGISGTKQINSIYAVADLAYKDQLFLTITGRNDWSSALVYTNGTGTYSYFYPSISSSWLFTEAFEKPDWLSYGQLRASWAQVGSDTSPYNINKGYSVGSIEYEGGKFVYTNSVNSTAVDPGIVPELKTSFEIGTDIRLLHNRLGVDFTYFNDVVENQIGNVPAPAVSGYNSLLSNIGTIAIDGIEVTLSGTPIRTENFEWRSTFNYWTNNTTIKELHEDYGEYKNIGGSIGYGNFRVGSVAYEGGDYGVLMSDSAIKEYQAVDASGNEIDDPRNGMKVLRWSDSRRGAMYQRSGSVEEVGSLQPDFEGSFNNEFTYKGITLAVLLDARYGGHGASYSSKYGTAYGYLERSLRGRDAEYGGIEWTTGYDDFSGDTYTDGIIPDGIFADGQMVTSPSGTSVDVGGMTYQEAYDQGIVEPTHASFYNYFTNSWSSGVVNDDWFAEIKYIAVRNVSLGYNFPKEVSDKIAASNLYVSLNGRNLGYLYNSLPNDINPESFRGTTSGDSFRERGFSPYTASYTFTIAIDF